MVSMQRKQANLTKDQEWSSYARKHTALILLQSDNIGPYNPPQQWVIQAVTENGGNLKVIQVKFCLLSQHASARHSYPIHSLEDNRVFWT